MVTVQTSDRDSPLGGRPLRTPAAPSTSVRAVPAPPPPSPTHRANDLPEAGKTVAPGLVRDVRLMADGRRITCYRRVRG